MRTKMISAFISAAAALFFVGPLHAQDTVRVHDTVHVKEVVKEQQTTQTQTVEPKKDETPSLRAGELGFRFMPTFTRLNFQNAQGNTIEADATVSYGYGVMLGINFSKNVGLMGEVDYLGIDQKYKDNSLEHRVHINYVDIPLMLQFNTDKTKPVNLNLVVGPQFGINVGSSVNTSGTSETDTVKATIAVKQGDVGLAYGAGLEFALNKMHTVRLDLGFRGVYGLVDISGKNTGPDTYNVLVRASRKAYGGYAGLTFCF